MTLRWFDPADGVPKQVTLGPFDLDVAGQPILDRVHGSSAPQAAGRSLGPLGRFSADGAPGRTPFGHLGLALLLIAGVWPRPKVARVVSSKGPEYTALELALAQVVGGSVRGLTRAELLDLTGDALSKERHERLAEQLKLLDEARYAGSVDVDAEEQKIADWLGGEA